VCSSSLAIAAALGLVHSLNKGQVAEFTCTAERYVGVTSGGMDQAISVMGMPNVAMLVEFNPVRDMTNSGAASSSAFWQALLVLPQEIKNRFSCTSDCEVQLLAA